MIVARTGDAYRFVTQPAHASLAGQLADRWGSDAFSPPAVRPSALVAAYAHDDGWWDYDRRPHQSADGTPIGFTGVPAETWIDLYRRGIDAAVDLDPYAGLLVSMHGAGLRRRRYGLSPSWPPVGEPFEGFVDREEARQRRLADRLAEDGSAVTPDGPRRPRADETAFLRGLHETGTPPEGTESALWFDYRLLQAWDVLSLAVCTTPSPPGSDGIDRVPTAPDGPERTLTLEPAGEDAIRMDPYPFDASPVSVRVPARTVPTAAAASDEDLLYAYYDAPPEVLSVEFVPAGA